MNTQHNNESVRDFRTRNSQVTSNQITNIQPTWTTRTINSSQLKSKQDYQRPIKMEFVKECIANFDPNKVEPVHVSYRDGKYYVMDGQHTILILEGANGNKPIDVRCIVHNGMTYEEESDWTSDQYEKKHPHKYNEMAKARYEAGRKLERDVATRVKNIGGRLVYDKTAKTGMKIGASKRVINLYQKDSDNTILAIKCLVEAYKGRETTLPADIIAGTMEFLRLYKNDILISRLTEALSKFTPHVLTNTAKNLKMTYPINWTETIRDKYNGMSRKGKLKPKYMA